MRRRDFFRRQDRESDVETTLEWDEGENSYCLDGYYNPDTQTFRPDGRWNEHADLLAFKRLDHKEVARICNATLGAEARRRDEVVYDA